MKASHYLLLALCTLLGAALAPAATVTTLADSGPGSLRAAMEAGGTIDFAVTGVIELVSGEIAVHNPVHVLGPGAGRLTIQRSTAAPDFRLFRVLGEVTLSGVTLRNGLVGTADGYEEGACILNQGELVLRDCALIDNVSVGGWTRGTAICNHGGLTVGNCLFARNVATGFASEGAGIYNYGRAALTNCTFSGNVAGYGGGALANDGFADGLFLDSCTVVSNSARFSGALWNGGAPNWFAGYIELRNNLITGNGAWNIENRGDIISRGFNLVGEVVENPILAEGTDQTGVSVDELRLGPLADNGGSTWTHALLNGSLARDAGPASDFPPADQRGVLRPAGARADVGAFESDALEPVIVSCPVPLTLDAASPAGTSTTLTAFVATAPGQPPSVVWWVNGVPRQASTLPSVGPSPVSLTTLFAVGLNDVTVVASVGADAATCSTAVLVRDPLAPTTVRLNSTADSGYATLRQAIDWTPTNGTVVLAVTGAITLTRGELKVFKPLNLEGPGAQLLTIQRSEEPGTPAFRIFQVMNGPASISGLTIRNGRVNDTWGRDNGAGIQSRGDLTLRDCVLRDHTSTVEGDRGIGLCAFSGTARLINCTFANNRGDGVFTEGDGLYNWIALTLATNCTFSGNAGTAIHNDAYSAGLVLHSCTIVGNGLGLYNNGPGPNTLAIRNSLMAGNAAVDFYNHDEDFTSGGWNFFGRVEGSGVALNPTDRLEVSVADLHLGPLQDNGGPTSTHALLPGSLAIDAGDTADCPATDQRGVSRPHYARCDAGAFEADQMPPTIRCPDPVDHACDPGPVTETLRATVQDPDGDAFEVIWTVNGVAWQTNRIPAGGPPTTATVDFTAQFPTGHHTVAISASDGRFLPVVCAIEVTVGDTDPPVLHCPASFVVATDPGRCSAVVNYPPPAVTDNCPGVTVTCDPPPGTTFAKGRTLVTCTARDLGQQEARCSFMVTVKDCEPPTIFSLTASPSVLKPANHHMVPVTLRLTASDNCGKVISRIQSVTSSDPDRGKGHGERWPDWRITGPLTLELRAELADKSRPRIYTITVECLDKAGNKATRAVRVIVPAHKG